MYTLITCEEQFNLFHETMDYLLGTCFPHKTVSRHSTYKPWITDGFRHLIRQRQRSSMSGDMEIGKKTEEFSESHIAKIAPPVLPIKNRNARGIIDT